MDWCDGDEGCGPTAEKGALSQLYLGTSPEVEEQDLRGRYFVPVVKEAKLGMSYILWKEPFFSCGG